MLNPVVSFGRRHRYNKSECSYDSKKENNKKTVAAGSTVATAIAANKLAKKEISADSVVLEMCKQERAKDFSNINTMQNIIKTMEENKISELSEANFKKLSDAGVKVATEESAEGIKQNMPLEDLKAFVKTQILNTENKDSKLLGRKEQALVNYENLKEKMETFVDKSSAAYKKLE